MLNPILAKCTSRIFRLCKVYVASVRIKGEQEQTKEHSISWSTREFVFLQDCEDINFGFFVGTITG